MSKRSLENSEESANQVIHGFAQTIDASFQAEIQYIVGELQKNKGLTYTLSGLLKNDSLVALLDGRLAANSQSPASSQKPEQVRKLRNTARVFKHILQSAGVCDAILRKLLPSVFVDARDLKQLTDDLKIAVLCMLLVVKPTTPLPLRYYKDLVEVDKFIAACSQRFDDVMKSALGVATMEKVMKGYYEASGDGDVETIFKTTEGRNVKIQCGGDGGRVLDPFDLETGLESDVVGRKMVFKDLKASFEAEGVAFPVVPFVELCFFV